MPRPSEPTRARIVQAASALFYNEGIRRVSVDEVAAKEIGRASCRERV